MLQNADLIVCESSQTPDLDQESKRAVNQINILLKTQPEPSDEAQAALNELQALFPVPPTEIVKRNVWGTKTAKLLVNNHVKTNFADALSNIKLTGRNPSPEDEEWLRLILTHCSGWSAMGPSHIKDPWVQYIQALFSHLPGLVPILDSLVWPEELDQLPVRYSLIQPSFFLLATPEAYYVFDLEGSGLYCAGQSLEEVYLRMKESRYNDGKEGD